MTDPARSKAHLRERLRFRRRHFVASLDGMARLAAFRALPSPLAEAAAAHAPVAGYAPWGDEPDILAMLEPLGTIALPRHAARVAAMDFCRWHSGDALTKGPWGAMQPAPDAEPVVPGLILCPLVGFDRRGGRIGQGGGHYDRWFAAHPDTLRVGIGWSVQEVDTVPTEPTDIALDAILTEQEFILCGDRM